MNFAVKPLSLRKQSPQYTNQQVMETGCCFRLFSSNFVAVNEQIDFNPKRYSQPKIKKEKKIDLMIAKKGNSQPKSLQNISAKSSNNCLNNKNQLKNIQSTINYTSLTSKITTQRNSLKNSRAKLTLDNREKNIDNQQKNEKCLNLAPKYLSFNSERLLQQQVTKAQITNIQYISEISMIEQQFISHDSTALNALNFLNHFPFSQSKGQEMITPVRYMIDAVIQNRNEQIRQKSSPLHKLSNKKKIGGKNSPRQRLCL